MQFWSCSDCNPVLHVCLEARVHDRSVFVFDLRVADHVADSKMVRRKRRKRRREEEKPHPPLAEKLHDLCKDRKRRIVNNDLVLFVLPILVVSSRIKRPDELALVELVFIGYPIRNRVINVVRCVAVVCGLFRFELVNKCLIFLVVFVVLSGVVLVSFFEPVQLFLEVSESITAHVDFFQRIQLRLQLLQIEVRVHCQLVMDDRICSPLLITQPVQPDDRNLFVSEFLRCDQSSMPFDDLVMPDSDRIQVTELFHAQLDLLDLPVRMFFSISKIRL